jgi:WD domain, G-beta repeat
LRTFTGHAGFVFSVFLSTDGRFILSGSGDGTIRIWALDWELEDRLTDDWDEGARSYLENFLVLHTPYAATLPSDRIPSDKEIILALTRCGTPTWTDADFQSLLYILGCAGYGWLRPAGVRQQLENMMAKSGRSLHLEKKQRLPLNQTRPSDQEMQRLRSPQKDSLVISSYIFCIFIASLFVYLGLTTGNVGLSIFAMICIVVWIFDLLRKSAGL